MDRYLNKTDCNSCFALPTCFIQSVKQIDEFYNLPKTHITYRKGETIIKEGTTVTNVLFILDGLVKLYIEGPERNIIIKFLRPNDFIGLTSLFGDESYYFSAAALKETKVCSIPPGGIKQLIAECCDFSRNVAHWYCKNYNLMLSKCMNLGLRQLNGKFASTLLYLNREEFREIDVFSYISRKDLAELSGMSIESLVRILAEFSDEKIIELDGKTIRILDLERLKIINQKG